MVYLWVVPSPSAHCLCYIQFLEIGKMDAFLPFSQQFWETGSQDHNPQRTFVYIMCWSEFTVLEINTKSFKNYVYLNITIINPLHVNINTIFIKISVIQKQLMRTFCFAHLLNIWTKRHSGVSLWFFFYHVACGCWKTPLWTCKIMGEAEIQHFGTVMKIVWILCFGDPQGSSDQTLKTTALHFKCVYFWNNSI